jgi:hypothetical protein
MKWVNSHTTNSQNGGATPSQPVPDTSVALVSNEPNHLQNSTVNSPFELLDSYRKFEVEWRRRNPGVELPLDAEDAHLQRRQTNLGIARK